MFNGKKILSFNEVAQRNEEREYFAVGNQVSYDICFL